MSHQAPSGPSPAGPPPQQPYGPPRGRSRGAIVVGVLVVVGGGVAAAILLLGGGDDPDLSTTSPLDTAESFEQSWNLSDTRALKSLMTDDLRPFVNVDQFDMDQIELDNPEVVDENATEAVAVLDGGDNTYELYLVKQKGEWLIQELNIDTIP